MSLKKFLLSKLFLKNLSIAILSVFGLLLITFLWLRIYTHHGQAIEVPDFYGFTEEQIAETCKEKKFRYEIIDSVFSNAVPRGTVIDQNPNPGFHVKKNRRIFFTINAKLPQKIEMPNLVGVSLRQAKAFLETAGLNVGTLQYVPDLATNVVLKQKFKGNIIDEGTEIIKGDTIDLVLGRGLSNEKAIVPDLIGLRAETAKRVIIDASLNVGAVKFDKSFSTGRDSAEAFVWSQYPKFDGERELPLGSIIDLWITVDSTRLPNYHESQIDNIDE